jgi:hypothetical protein
MAAAEIRPHPRCFFRYAALHQATPERDPGDTLALRAEIEGLGAQLALMREHADELRHQLDGWQNQAEASQRLLADQRPRRGWFGLGSKARMGSDGGTLREHL